MFFKDVFFPSIIILEWETTDPSLRNSASYSIFKSGVLKFRRPSPNEI